MDRGHLSGEGRSPPRNFSGGGSRGCSGVSSGVCTPQRLLSRMFGSPKKCTRMICPELRATELSPEELISIFRGLSIDDRLPRIIQQKTTQIKEAANQLTELQSEKEWLELRLKKRRKNLQLERSQEEALTQQIYSVERKLKRYREIHQQAQREQRHLETATAILEESGRAMRREKEKTTRVYLEWLERKNEFVAETAKERRQADVVRRQRGQQVKGLLRALNRETRLQVDREVLRPFGCLHVHQTKRAAKTHLRAQQTETETVAATPELTASPPTLKPKP